MWGAQCVVVRGSGNFETKVISSSSELNWSTNILIEAMSSDDMDKIMDSIMSLSTLSIAFLHREFTSKLQPHYFTGSAKHAFATTALIHAQYRLMFSPSSPNIPSSCDHVYPSSFILLHYT